LWVAFSVGIGGYSSCDIVGGVDSHTVIFLIPMWLY